MAAEPSPEAHLASTHGPLLLGLAGDSIRHGLAHGSPLPVVPADYPAEVRGKHATFVTLERDGAVRGCVGKLQQLRPLVQEVVANAFAAAFLDGRFEPLAADELDGLDLTVSLLTSPEPLPFRSEAELLDQLVPGRDGLIIKVGWARALFLPAVWESLPEPVRFLEQLKRKAGLPAHGPVRGLKAARFFTECVTGRVGSAHAGSR
jgi:AmmeMemoRadiSam system protein A